MRNRWVFPSRRRKLICGDCSRTKISMRFPLRRRTTGTRSPGYGLRRRAKIYISRNLARIICGKAGNKYKVICQHGSQCRSSAAIREAMEKMQSGLLGDIYMARGLCYKWRDTIGHTPVSPVPPGVHYDLWTGPAPLHPFTRNRFHYNWHWFWDYGNGDLGNQGIHEVDLARWGLGVTWPYKV